MIADKLKLLREQRGLTQSEVAKKMGVTRSCVNAWEMGVSAPSTHIVELAVFYRVSADYLLEVPSGSTVSVDGLSEKEIAFVVELIELLKTKKDRN